MAKRGSLIFVHSQASSPHLWDAQVAEFGRNYHVKVYGLGEVGGSEKRGAQATALDAEVEALAHLIDTWSARRPVVVSHFLAGTVLLLLAARRAAIMDGVVVVGSAACYARGGDDEVAIGDTIQQFREAATRSLEEAVRSIVVLQLSDPASAELQRGWIAHMLRDVTTGDVLGDVRLLDEADIRGVLGGVGIPTLIVRGEEDRLVPAGAAAVLQEAVRGSQLVTMEECGNMPQLTQPVRFNAVLERFLRELRFERNMLALYFSLG
jgi:pimeloyl-[acyl-carrier protein] methyl ester esterase